MHIFIATAVLMVIFGAAYGYFRERSGTRSLTWKAAATLMALLLCAYGDIHGTNIAGSMVFVGILFCMIADVVLELNFRKGICVFFVAHICFIISCVLRVRPMWYTFAIFVTLYMIVLLMFRKDISGLEELKEVSLAYMAMLCFMLSMAVTLWTETGTKGAAFAAVGAFCFVISDCMIAWKTVRRRKELWVGAVLLIFYYTAIYLLATSVCVGF